MNNESDDFKQQISECYHIMGNRLADPQQVQEASDFLIEFYSDTSSFWFIVNFILETNDHILQNNAIIGIKIILQNNEDLLQNPDTFNSLFDLSIAKSAFIRKFAIIYISEFKCPDELIVQFVQSIFNPNTEETIDEIQIESCAKLMTIVLNSVDEDKANQYIEICSALSAKALDMSNLDVIISGAILQLSFIHFIQDGEDQTYQEYITSSFQVLDHCLYKSVDSNEIDELINAMKHFINNDPYSVDYQYLIEISTNYLSNPDVLKGISEQLLFLADTTLEACQDILKKQENVIEIILPLFESYCIYSKKTYISNSPYLSSKHLTFSTFFKVFYEDQFISEIYSNIPALFNEESAGKFTSLLILDSSFELSSDFYISKISDLYSLLQESFSDEDFCVKSTASYVISDFCKFANPSIEYDSIISSLIECLSESPTIEFLKALSDIFTVSSQTDTFYDQSFSFLFQFLDDNTDIILRQHVITCLSSLTKSSNERVCANFDQMFEVMSQIVLSDSSDEINSALFSPAVSCLSNLCSSCTISMEAFIPSFIEIIAARLEDQPNQLECIKALSNICQFFPQQAQPSVEESLLSNLFEIASAEVDLESVDPNEFENENGEEDEIIFDDEEFACQSEISSNAEACRTVCRILSLYPHLLEQHFEEAFEMLLHFKESFSGFGTVACAVGSTFIAKTLVDIKDEEVNEFASRLLNEILLPLSKGSDDNTSGLAFRGLSTLILKDQSLVSEELFDALSMALKGELFFQRGRVTYNETLFNGIYHLFKSLMKLNFFNEIQKFISIIQEFLNSDSEGLRDFSLKFFGCFITISGGIHNLNEEMESAEELASSIIQFALTVENGYASIEFLIKLIETIPDSIADEVPNIINIITSRVFESDDENSIKSEPVVIEKCIILIAVLLNKFDADISPFINLIIQSSPPIILLRKTNIFYQLIQLINELQDGSLNQLIAAAAIRLFSEPDNLINKRNLSPDDISKIKELIHSLSESIPNFNDFCAQACSNDEFKMNNLNNHVFES